MDYVKPVDVAAAMMSSARNKLARLPLDLIIRGGLAGALALYLTHKPRRPAPLPLTMPTQVPAE